MKKPCRIELNNSGAWKLLGKFDAANAEATDNILSAAGALADALNARESGRQALVTLRVSTDEPCPDVLMRHKTGEGWVPAPGTSAVLAEARKQAT